LILRILSQNVGRYHLLGLVDRPMCRRCEMGEETSAHVLCECEALALLRHAHLGSFSMELRDIMHTNVGAIYGYARAVGLP
jgi:hypothetical protein